MRSSTERIGNLFMSTMGTCAYGDYFYPSANCAFVTSEVVNEEDTKHTVIVCMQD